MADLIFDTPILNLHESYLGITTRKKRFAILDGQKVIPTQDVLIWGRWLEANGPVRIVAKTYLFGFEISTVFLGLNQNYLDEEPALWFETMVFKTKPVNRSRFDEFDMDRYTTYAQAVKGHRKIALKYIFKGPWLQLKMLFTKRS